jgi:hypothetical protein
MGWIGQIQRYDSWSKRTTAAKYGTQTAARPTRSTFSLVVNETIAFILLRAGQLHDHVREFEEPLFCHLTFGQWMTGADHNRLLLLIERGATNVVRWLTEPADEQVNLIAFELANNIEAIQRETCRSTFAALLAKRLASADDLILSLNRFDSCFIAWNSRVGAV